MTNDRSRDALLEFLDYLADKGLMAKNTATARKAAANKVLGVLQENEASDVLAIDLDDAMMRFQNLEGKNYTPGSLSTYRSRVKAALDDFASYLNNPLGFRPSVQARDRKPRNTKSETSGATNDDETIKSAPTSRRAPVSSNILPIPIRPDLTIHIQGLPFDLTESEARKISNVILAMAAPAT